MSSKKVRLVALFAALLLSAPYAFADHNININTADKAALETLTGIGPSKAQAIIDYRTQNGPFATIEDIQNVSGIGPATYANIKDHITVQGGNSTASSPSPGSSPPPSSAAAPSPQSAAPSSSSFSVEGGSDRIVVANADVQFTARAYSSKAAAENAAFSWNFGDGSTGQGAFVTHRFEYPGSYAVVLTGSYDGTTASDHFTVTAEEAQLSVRVLEDSGVEITNLAARDVDLSRWIIRSGGQRFTLPENSLVLAGLGMRISPNTLHFYASESTELDYPSGSLAFRAIQGQPEIIPTSSPAAPIPIEEEIARVAYTPPANFAPKQSPEKGESEHAEEAATLATSSQVAAAGAASASWPWWLGAVGISIAAAAAIFVARRFGRNEWNIIEDAAE